MYASKLIVSPLAITSIRITLSVSQKTVIMSFLAEGLLLDLFFLVIADDATPLTAFSSPAHNAEPSFHHL